MAILFSCPYCTASVKVPDSASGKLGECPKCGTKIRIPTIAIPAQAAAGPVQTAPVVPAPPAPVMTPAPPPSASADPFDFSAAAMATAASAPGKSAEPRKKPTPRQPMSPKVLIGIGLGLLVLAGIGIGVYIQSLPVYEGNVAGARVPQGQVIAVTVPWSTIEVPPQTQLPVIEYLKQHKTALVNNLLKIDVSATSEGLVVRFETTDESILISVDPLLVPDVQTLIAEQKDAWNAARTQELTQYAQELCGNLAKAQAAGERLGSFSAYEHKVAYNSLVRGLGRYCTAQASKSSHACVFEDDEGKLYFVVPRLTTQVVVQEKIVEGRAKALPADFRIWATIPPSAAATPHIEPADPEEEPEPATDDKKPKPKKPAADGEAEAASTDESMKPEKPGDGKMMKPGMEKMMKK